MDTSSIVGIHNTIGYSDADVAELKKIRLVWQKLERLKAKAAKGDVQALRDYRDFLVKNLELARRVQNVEDPDTASTEFWAWYLGRCSELGIPAKEVDRGADHQEWCQRWLPAAWKTFAEAVEATIEMPSLRKFDEAKEAAEKMLQAYIGAFTDNQRNSNTRT